MTNNEFFSGYDGNSNSNNQLMFEQNSMDQLPKVMLRWIDHNSQAIIMIFNKEGRLQYVSQSIESVLNILPKNILGKRWRKLFSIEKLKYIEKFFSKNDSSIETIKVSIKSSSNELKWFNSTLSSINYNNEQYCLMSLIDITHQVKLEELIVQSEKLSVAGQLAAAIVHEIRNPLTALKGFLQLLAAGVDAKDAYYKIMIDEINKIETIASELLFMAKPMTASKQAESIHHMIEEVIALLQSEARMKNIQIIGKNLLDTTVFCNRTQIKQALINIVKNAIEAVDADGKIMITMNIHDDNYVSIDIIDEGPGVSEDIIHKLSEPFYTTKREGTGLGLMVTQKIIDEHQGTLQVKKNETKGSTFRLKLPIYNDNKK